MKKNSDYIVYAHRGASSYAPENTMSSFLLGIELGANGIELDLQKTKDNKIVIFHDDTIDKKSNGTGKIEDYTYDQLYQLDFGSWFDSKYNGEHIVLFEDFAKEFFDKNLTFAIELKSFGIEEQVLKIINKYKRHDLIYISSFDYAILKKVRELDDKIKISWLVNDSIHQENINKLLKICGNQICPIAEKVTEEGIKLANENGLGVRLWGVFNEKIMEDVYLLDIQGMTVNFPDKLLKLLEDKR